MLNYRIHNHKKLLSDIVAEDYEKLVYELTTNLKKLFKRYSKPTSLEIILSEDGGQFNLTLEINLKSGPVIVKRSGSELDQITKNAFYTLKREIISALQKERREHLRERKARQARQLIEIEKHLDESYQQSDKLTFEQLFKAGIPGLKSYLDRRLHQAQQLGMPKNTITGDMVINDLNKRIYDKFSDHPKRDDELLAWVYQEADNLLEEMLKEKNILEPESGIETLKHLQTGSIKEEDATDTEADELPIDEIESASYLHNLYDLQDIFADNPEEADRLEDPLDLLLNREEFHERVLNELGTQPFFNRAVFDLYTLEKFDENEIAEMKNCSAKEVKDALRNTRTFLKERIRSWAKSPEEAV